MKAIIFYCLFFLSCNLLIAQEKVFNEILNPNDKELLVLKGKMMRSRKKDRFYKLESEIILPADTVLLKKILLDVIYKNKFKKQNIKLIKFYSQLHLNIPKSEVGETSYFYYEFYNKKKKYEVYAVAFHVLNSQIIYTNLHRYYERD